MRADAIVRRREQRHHWCILPTRGFLYDLGVLALILSHLLIMMTKMKGEEQEAMRVWDGLR
jgi:hypothetical protein